MKVINLITKRAVNLFLGRNINLVMKNNNPVLRRQPRTWDLHRWGRLISRTEPWTYFRKKIINLVLINLPHQSTLMTCNNRSGNESYCYDGEQDTNNHCYWHYTQQHTKKKGEVINLRNPEKVSSK
jgi:hypothetical protein